MSVKPATHPRCESGSHECRLQQSARICQLGVWRMAGCRWREWSANCRTCTSSREPCLVRENNEIMCGLTFSDKAVFYLIRNGAHWRSSSLILGNYYKNEISGFKDRRWTLSTAILKKYQHKFGQTTLSAVGPRGGVGVIISSAVWRTCQSCVITEHSWSVCRGKF